MFFSVPGWAVPISGLKQQVEEPTKNGKNKAAKKRKHAADRINKDNVHDMYQQIVEREQPNPTKSGDKLENAKKEKRKEKKESKGKGEGIGKAPSTTGDGEDGGPVDNNRSEGEKDTHKAKGDCKEKGRKRKRGQDQGHEQRQGDEDMDKDNEKKKKEEDGQSTTTATLTPLQQAMRQKLISARFRHLNETLYTTDSSKAMEVFGSNPELFTQYHAGFSQQVNESWPSNPVDGYIKAIQTRGAVPLSKKPNSHAQGGGIRPLPRRPNGLCTVVDLGCGDARLARSLTPSTKKFHLSLQSYDLQAPDQLITKADISNLPIPDGSADVAIFCLSLMGTNWISFVEEAWRVLRSDGKGECWISEVKSRFGKGVGHSKKGQTGESKMPLSKKERKKLNKKRKREEDNDAGSDLDDNQVYAEDARPTDGGDETDVSAFIEVLRTRGFLLRPGSLDKSNKMFVSMGFVKQGPPPIKGKYAARVQASSGKKRFVDKANDSENSMSAQDEAKVLKPCVYKIR